MATDGRPTVSAAIIARDEERHLADCLAGLTWADEVVVVLDAATRDRSAAIARQAGARVEVREFEDFARQRDHALAVSTGEWVLFVDADERVRPALRDEVLRRVAAPGGCVGFWIPRENVILGRVVRGAGWYPDYQLRLLRRSAARFDPSRPVHELAMLDGEAGFLDSPFLHLSYRSLAEFARKQERYVPLEAERWLKQYGRPRTRALVGQPLREFWRRYVRLGGYREGWRGLALSALLAWYAARAVALARGMGA